MVQYIEHIFQQLVNVKFVTVVRALAKNGSFGFLSVGSCVGKNQMCHLCVGCLFTLTHNGQVLLQVGYFITSSPEPLPIENIKLKLTTKSQNYIRLPEQKNSDANSRSYNVQPHLQQYQC